MTDARSQFETRLRRIDRLGRGQGIGALVGLHAERGIHLRRIVGDRHRHVGEDSETRWTDLGKTAVDDDSERAAFAVNNQNSRPQCRDHRGMRRKYAEVAFRARNIDLIDLSGEQKLLGRNEIEMESGHRILLSSERQFGKWQIATTWH